MDIVILVRLLIIVILVAIIAYLAHVFIKKREISTLVLLAFFLVYCSERVYAVLGDSHLIINDWVLEISLGMILSTTALMIPIVMLRFRDFYIFPPLVGIALIAVNAVSSYYRNLVGYLFNIIFYLMGFNIWYPVVDLINTLYIQNDYIAMLANPVNSLLIPDPSYVYLLVSGGTPSRSLVYSVRHSCLERKER